MGEILHRPGREIRHVYFPLDSLISVTVTMSEGRTSEAGIVGSREMVGVNAFMGGRETNQTEYICQAPGSAMKVEAALLLEEFDRNKAVRDVLLRYTQAYIARAFPERRVQPHPHDRTANGTMVTGVPRPITDGRHEPTARVHCPDAWGPACRV